MKIILLNEKNVNAFRELDPFETLDRFSDPECLALGAVSQVGRFDEPAGLLVYTIEQDRLIIHWLFVRSEFREHGLGSYLLMLAFEEADRRDLAQVAVRISDEYDMDDPEQSSWEFFVNDIFKEVEEDEYVWRTSMKEMIKILDRDNVINENASSNAGIMNLRALSAKDRNEAIKSLNKHFSVNIEIPIWELLVKSDPDISFIRKSDNDYVGIISARKESRTLYVVELYSMDDVDEETLFRAVLSCCEDVAKITDNIEVNIKKRSVERLLDEMKMPGKKFNVQYLTADIDDYRKMKVNMPVNFSI